MPCVAVDLFCGIGGLTKGLELSGVTVIAGIDVDATCAFAYEENNNSQFICQDVTNVIAEDIMPLYPENSIRALVGCAHANHFQSILNVTEKMVKSMTNGDCYILLRELSKRQHPI